MMTRLAAALGTLVWLALAAPAGAAEPTLDSISAKEPPWGRLPSGISWQPDGRACLFTEPSQDPDEALPVERYDVASGKSSVWATPAAFGSVRTPHVAGWSPDRTSVAVTAGGSLYVVDASGANVRLVAKDAGDPRWSPKGGAIAYVHDADIYVATIGTSISVRLLTTGGIEDSLLNGEVDWVYGEELDLAAGFAWSSDASEIAYLRMDERPVTNFPIVDFLVPDNHVVNQRYPLAGEHNPQVSLRVVNVASATDRLVYDGAPKDEYIAAFDWVPGSHALEAELLDRAQKNLSIDLWNAGAGRPSPVYTQVSTTWVDVIPLPTWLPDGRSVWTLVKGARATASLSLRAAAGTWTDLGPGSHVVANLGVDAKAGVAYVRATVPDRRDSALLAVPLDGSAPRNLTPAAGGHQISLAPTFERFVDTYDTVNDPPRVSIVTVATSAATEMIPQNAALKASLLPVEEFEVPSSYGPLDASMLKPPHFDPAKKYPVVVYVYGGPEAPVVADSFGYQRGLYHQLLARAGFIVFSMDGPASQVDNADHVRLLYHNFGPGSLLGQEIGARYLASLPYVDAARIGIWGWSFGGFETAYAMTHGTLFAAGAAVAPVTDWHFYDSIYTERYMGAPQEDPKAYEASSVLPAAGSLHGPLLIQHGTSDDNVHLANTMALLQQFILARENRVQFYPYPRKVHSINGLAQRRSVYGKMLEFWKTVLAP
jgi:dipeptidyl-peptidase-4